MAQHKEKNKTKTKTFIINQNPPAPTNTYGDIHTYTYIREAWPGMKKN